MGGAPPAGRRAAAAVHCRDRARAAGRSGAAAAGHAAARACGRRLSDHPPVDQRPSDGIPAARRLPGRASGRAAMRPRSATAGTTRCAGVVLVRQRPGTAKGTVFMTIEDETGIANIVVWPKTMERFRKEVMGARLILIEGRVQKSVEGVVHIVAERLIDRTYEMSRLSDGSLESLARLAGAGGADRAGRGRKDAPPLRQEQNAPRPPPAQRPHPAAVAGLSLRTSLRSQRRAKAISVPNQRSIQRAAYWMHVRAMTLRYVD